MSNTGLLTIIAVILLGIFTILAIQVTEETPAEQISDSFSETMNVVQNEIQRE